MPYKVSSTQLVVTSVAVAGVISGAYCLYCFYQEKKKIKIPTEWKQVGTLDNIHIYPIKSCGRVTLEKAECTTMGLSSGWLKDRVLMVIDKKNNFVTGRAAPMMLLVETSMNDSVLSLKHPDMEPLSVDLAEVIKTKPFTSTLWRVAVPTYDCGEKANEWFSRLINKSSDNYRLVYYAANKCRKLISHAKFNTLTKDDAGVFHDESSYHLINVASMEELNSRLTDNKTSERTFRPCLVVSGPGPFEEDHWKFVKIGENIFQTVLPCQRCLMTTIDPETGTRNPKPLETLKTYRQIKDPAMLKIMGPNPVMGIHMGLRSAPGTLSVGDIVYVA